MYSYIYRLCIGLHGKSGSKRQVLPATLSRNIVCATRRNGFSIRPHDRTFEAMLIHVILIQCIVTPVGR